MKFFILLIVVISLSSYAKEQLAAHVHGSVSIDIATDKKQILIMLNSPAESFLGFENRPKSKKEKMILKTVKTEWNNVIQFLGSKLADCSVSNSKWEQKFSGKNHSSISAEAYIDCKKATAGRELLIAFKKHYKRVQSIKVQILREDGSSLNKVYNEKIFRVKI